MQEPSIELTDLIAPLHKDAPPLSDIHATPSEHAHSDTFMTVREATHRGKQIEVHTTYRILVDGVPLETHTSVLNDGKVHNHSLPQYAFPSAIDLVKKIIDLLDVELPEDELGPAMHHATDQSC